MIKTETDLDQIAGRLLAALDRVDSLDPLSDADPDFQLEEAYRVSGGIMRARNARGEKTVGWKIGFTNRGIWDEYDVHAPIWGPIYDSTLAMIEDDPASCGIGHLVEPRIEPEIAFRLSATPRQGMDERALLGCVDAVAHGLEIVQSIYPGWRFRAADTVAAFALHGRYLCGQPVARAAHGEDEWLSMLAGFEIGLFRGGEAIDHGEGRVVLDGPLSALRHFVDGFDERPFGRGLKRGDWVTTGTVTRAFPVKAGEIWRTELAGLPLPGLRVEFS